MDALALYGAVVGTVALGWQAASFVLAGGRVKATFRPGMVGGGGLITGPPAEFTVSFQSIRRTRHEQAHQADDAAARRG